MYSTQRKLLSQNLLRHRELASRLVRGSSIARADTVLEIGPGEGILTRELLKQAGQVIAVELDPQFCRALETRFANAPNLELHHSDFLAFPLPNTPYKVFSSLPFRLTGEIMRKLFRSTNPPSDAYLIVQKQAADKFAGNRLAALLLQPWFRITIECELKRTDFIPVPNVDAVLLRIQKRENPLIEAKNREAFEDFMAYVFSRSKPYVVNLTRKPTEMAEGEWVELFHGLLRSQDRGKLERIRGAAKKLYSEQERLKKIHRTRVDPSWKRNSDAYRGWAK